MVENEGEVSGAEVVQVYIGSAGAAGHRPIKMLRGFKRIELSPGESSAVEMDIALDDLKFYDVHMKAWVLDPVYRVYVGNNCSDAVRTNDVDFSI